MATHFGEVLHTKLFTFLIGPEETPIIVHAGVITRLSEPLERLVNGQMLEAQENLARFSDLKAGDFERICEFAYRGIYTSPKPERFTNEEVKVTKDIFHLADPMKRPYVFHTCHSKTDDEMPEPEDPADRPSIKSHDPQAVFWTAKTPCANSPVNWPRPCTENVSWREDFAPVFLGHARLYVFAEQYLIPALKYMALENLRKTLGFHTLFVSGLDAVIQLARFAYDDDWIPDRDDAGIDPLRQTVLAYIVKNQKHFLQHAGHRRLLETQSEFAADYVSLIANWFDPSTFKGKEERRS